MELVRTNPVRLENRTYRGGDMGIIPLKLTLIVRLGNRTYRPGINQFLPFY